MPLDIAKPFARLAAEADDLAVAGSKTIARSHELEAGAAGYNLEKYLEAKKANTALVPRSAAATRERVMKAFAAEKRLLAKFLAGLRTKLKA